MPLPELYTLDDVAKHFGWERWTLTRALKRHRISPIGRGRRARLTESDVLKLIEAERQPVEKIRIDTRSVERVLQSDRRRQIARMMRSAAKDKKPKTEL